MDNLTMALPMMLEKKKAMRDLVSRDLPSRLNDSSRYSLSGLNDDPLAFRLPFGRGSHMHNMNSDRLPKKDPYARESLLENRQFDFQMHNRNSNFEEMPDVDSLANLEFENDLSMSELRMRTSDRRLSSMGNVQRPDPIPGHLKGTLDWADHNSPKSENKLSMSEFLMENSKPSDSSYRSSTHRESERDLSMMEMLSAYEKPSDFSFADNHQRFDDDSSRFENLEGSRSQGKSVWRVSKGKPKQDMWDDDRYQSRSTDAIESTSILPRTRDSSSRLPKTSDSSSRLPSTDAARWFKEEVTRHKEVITENSSISLKSSGFIQRSESSKERFHHYDNSSNIESGKDLSMTEMLLRFDKPTDSPFTNPHLSRNEPPKFESLLGPRSQEEPVRRVPRENTKHDLWEDDYHQSFQERFNRQGRSDVEDYRRRKESNDLWDASISTNREIENSSSLIGRKGSMPQFLNDVYCEEKALEEQHIRSTSPSSRRYRSRSPRRYRSRSPRRNRTPRRSRSKSPRKFRGRSPKRFRSRSPRRSRDFRDSSQRFRNRSPIERRDFPPRSRIASPLERRGVSPGCLDGEAEEQEIEDLGENALRLVRALKLIKMAVGIAVKKQKSSFKLSVIQRGKVQKFEDSPNFRFQTRFDENFELTLKITPHGGDFDNWQIMLDNLILYTNTHLFHHRCIVEASAHDDSVELDDSMKPFELAEYIHGTNVQLTFKSTLKETKSLKNIPVQHVDRGRKESDISRRDEYRQDFRRMQERMARVNQRKDDDCIIIDEIVDDKIHGNTLRKDKRDLLHIRERLSYASSKRDPSGMVSVLDRLG